MRSSPRSARASARRWPDPFAKPTATRGVRSPVQSMPAAAPTVHPARAVPAPKAPRFDEEPVLGIPLALTTYAKTLDWIDAAIAEQRRGYICVAATHTVMVCQEDPELRDAVLGADFTVPDGQPLVWAMNAL